MCVCIGSVLSSDADKAWFCADEINEASACVKATCSSCWVSLAWCGCRDADLCLCDCHHEGWPLLLV